MTAPRRGEVWLVDLGMAGVLQVNTCWAYQESVVAKNVRVTGENFTHQTLWRTAKHFLADGTAEPKESFYPPVRELAAARDFLPIHA